MDKPEILNKQFKKELGDLLNKHSIENECDMPDFLLAEMIANFIQAFVPQMPNPPITAIEALHGFGVWLTSRNGTLKIGSAHNAAIMVELIDEWSKTNNLDEPRPIYPKNIIQPNKCHTGR